MSLPAGKFLVWAKAQIFNDNHWLVGNNDRQVMCDVESDNGMIDWAVPYTPGSEVGVVNLQGVLSAGAAQDIVLKCNTLDAQTPSDVFVSDIRLDAAQVSTLSQSTEP